jgi:hypothetical protein
LASKYLLEEGLVLQKVNKNTSLNSSFSMNPIQKDPKKTMIILPDQAFMSRETE